MSTSAETSFSISISDSQLSILQQKLALAALPDELEDAGVAYGAALPDIQRLVNFWKNSYDWRKHEASINAELPQFTRDIPVDAFGPLNIHYVHMRSAVEDAIPLLFVHGWPGSFLEVRKILPLLVGAPPEHPSFHVVALSLPGFGFSAGPTMKGFALDQYAEATDNGLSISKVTQGGDWGFFVCAFSFVSFMRKLRVPTRQITRRMANLYGPEHIKAWHTNFPCTSPPSLKRPLLLISYLLSYLPYMGYTESEKVGLQRTQEFLSSGSGYFAIQSTRPQTLGYGLTDSPVGLLAWIYEKLAASVAPDMPFTDDESPAASLRIYYEVVKSQGKDALVEKEDTVIPLGHSYFPKEAINLPKSWHKAPNLVFEAEHESGGHFAAFEQPEALVADLRAMFGKNGPAFGAVKGKTGWRETAVGK
ncbi:hypothetical protein DXG01_003485 [Tephrocybe rancida]|nr:hypothetical protein DXG01_003485 [Tephrocybe rancida]